MSIGSDPKHQVIAAYLLGRESPLPLVQFGELTERQKHIVLTHSEAVELVRDWVKYLSKSKPASSNTEEKNLNALSIPPRPNALIGKNLADISHTPFEDWRMEKDLTLKRNALYDKLSEKLSLAGGLELLDEWTIEHARVRCRNIADARKVFPSLTASEIAFLPLLKKLPQAILTLSVSYNAVRAMRKETPSWREGWLKKEYLQLTPGRGEMRTDGIAWGSEDTGIIGNENDYDSGVNPLDREVVPYVREVSEILAEIQMLSIDTTSLFILLKNKATDAFVVGAGRIQRAALEYMEHTVNTSSTALSVLSEDKLKVPLSDRIAAIREHEKEVFKEAQLEFASRVLGAEIRHAEGERLSAEEIAQLIGLLPSIPRCLMQESIFNGRILFDGTSIIFADDKSVIQEQCALDPECLQLLKYAIFDQLSESTDKHQGMKAIEENLEERLNAKVLGAAISGEINDLSKYCSILEEAALFAHKEFGINFHALGDKEIKTYPAELILLKSKAKFGYEEAQLITEIFKRAGKEALREISDIYKEIVPSNSERGMSTITKGQISDVKCVVLPDGSRSFCITELDKGHYTHLGPGGRGERAFLLLYSIAKELFSRFPSEDKNFFANAMRAPLVKPGALKKALSKADDAAQIVVIAGEALRKEKKPVRGNFAHPVGMRGIGDDFAATFAAYLIALPDLREQAKNSAVLSEKVQRMGRFVQSLGIEEKNLMPGLFKLKHLQNGAKATLKIFPDMHDEADIKNTVKTMTEITEAHNKSLTSKKGSLQSVEEFEMAQSQAERMSDLKSALADLFEVDIKNSSVRKIASSIINALETGGPEDIKDEVRRALKNPYHRRIVRSAVDRNFEDKNGLVREILQILSDRGYVEST